jgi:hypothetical protein
MVVAFNGKDCYVQIYIDATTAGIIPDGTTKTWAADSQTVAIATSASVNTSKTLTPHFGLNNTEAQVIKQGNVSHEFSIDNLFTTELFGTENLQTLIDHGTVFALKLTADDATGTEAAGIELANCALSADNVDVADDGDLTCSLTGMGTAKTFTIA